MERAISSHTPTSHWGPAVAVAAAFLAVSCTPALPPPASAPPSAPQDAWDLWAGGTALRGANIWQRFIIPDLDGEEFLGAGPIGPPYIQEDFDRLASLGANYVNLSHPGLFTETPPYTLDTDAQANLDRLLEMAAEADLFVVITFRTGPGRSDFTFYRDGAGEWFDEALLIETVWSDTAAQEAWAEMWRYAAARYGDNPVVVGFDLMCEPNADAALGLWDPDAFYSEYAGTLYDWNQLYPRLVAAVREVDPETPILVSPMGWGSVEWLPYLEPIPNPHIVYAVHQYAPNAYTHQEPPDSFDYPGELDLDWDGDPDAFDRRWLESALAPIDDFVTEHGAPVAVNEFGVTRWSPGAAEFLADQMDLFEARGANYALWVWDSTWQPCTHQVNGFGLRFGPDPANEADVPNAVLEAVERAWARNTIRPSSFSRETAPTLDEVRTWLYLLDTDLDEATLAQIEASAYDMLVLDFIPSQDGNADYPMVETIGRLHRAPHPKLVLAYLDIGEAEDYRSYWQPEWRAGSPAWILGSDPEGWEGNFPVAYWHDDWRAIWFGPGGVLRQIAGAGFDGMYLDWVEAYDDEAVIAAAAREGLDPRSEMIRFVAELATTARAARPGFLVIVQNAAALLSQEAYARVLDGVAQEQIWFDGGPDDDPPGDCPLPRTVAEIDGSAYIESLSAACRRLQRELADGTLHTSTEEYLTLLQLASSRGLPILTVDYAVDPVNVAAVYAEARRLGWIPYVTNRALDTFYPPTP